MPGAGRARRGDLGHTREKALAKIEEVLKMVVASMIEHGEPIQPSEAVQISQEPLVAVTV